MSKMIDHWIPFTFSVTPLIGGFIGGIFVRKNIKGWYEVTNNFC